MIAIYLKEMSKIKSANELEKWYENLNEEEKIMLDRFLNEINEKTFAYALLSFEYNTAYMILDLSLREELNDMLIDEDEIVTEQDEIEQDINAKVNEDILKLKQVLSDINIDEVFPLDLYDGLNNIKNEIDYIYKLESDEEKIDRVNYLANSLGGNNDEK